MNYKAKIRLPKKANRNFRYNLRRTFDTIFTDYSVLDTNPLKDDVVLRPFMPPHYKHLNIELCTPVLVQIQRAFGVILIWDHVKIQNQFMLKSVTVMGTELDAGLAKRMLQYILYGMYQCKDNEAQRFRDAKMNLDMKPMEYGNYQAIKLRDYSVELFHELIKKYQTVNSNFYGLNFSKQANLTKRWETQNKRFRSNPKVYAKQFKLHLIVKDA